MAAPFPFEITLEQAYEAVEGHSSFCIHGRSDHIIVDYKLAPSTVVDYEEYPKPNKSQAAFAKSMPKRIPAGTKPESNKESSEAEDPEKQAFLRAVRKECRGLVFCKRSGRCISRRFHKCHHITELPKEDWPDITQTQFSVLEKMSGLLVAPYVTEGKLRWAGRTGVTKTSDVVEEFVASTEGEYAAFAQTWIDKGFTPLFNWYHPDMPTARTLAGRVVVDNGAGQLSSNLRKR